MITINFSGIVNNDSLQIGDSAYYVTSSPLGGFQQSTVVPTFFGRVEAIAGNSIDVDETVQGNTPFNVPLIGDFIMFAKDTSANLSGLVGYYAEVKINNNSTDKAEMFSIASEITPSSK